MRVNEALRAVQEAHTYQDCNEAVRKLASMVCMRDDLDNAKSEDELYKVIVMILNNCGLEPTMSWIPDQYLDLYKKMRAAVRIMLTCPNCGSTVFLAQTDGSFECFDCGERSFPEQMGTATERKRRFYK